MIQYNQRRRQIVLNLLVGHQNNIKLSYPIHVFGLFYGRELDFSTLAGCHISMPNMIRIPAPDDCETHFRQHLFCPDYRLPNALRTCSSTWISGSQKHRYIKCENFVAMVAKTLLKPAFSPPSLHKTAKICSDGIWHDKPDLTPDQTSRLGSRSDIQTWLHDLYRTWHQLGAWLSISLESRQAIQIRPGEDIRHRRVMQYTELQIFTQDACLPSHAGIWTKLLTYRHLQNTLNDVLQQKPNPETHPHGKALRKTSRSGMEIRHRRVTQCTELQVVTQDACLPRHAGIWAKHLAYRHL